MEMTGEYRIPVDRAAVWKALNDPRILTEAIPGCEDLVRNPDGSMSGRFVATSGPGTPAFASTIALASVVEGQSLTITGEGDGGSAGSVKGVADVRLADDGAGTLLTYVLRTQLGGTLAQLGSRQIDATAKTMIEGVLGALGGRLGDLPTIASTPSLATPRGGRRGREAAARRRDPRLGLPGSGPVGDRRVRRPGGRRDRAAHRPLRRRPRGPRPRRRAGGPAGRRGPDRLRGRGPARRPRAGLPQRGGRRPDPRDGRA